ncbi:hypothetical protein DLM45_06970 [Hyphomicrobium methylovorum]|uniref:hypothetical protein n=1 Tax=Hyphomicrobium methylovorum TaxID=84 RepID=UPI0015E690DA|nr:hypothetical protein [Hyphomicrobium methylovorum]MBA2125965.1 hypothetical protein [Hyphomicrobium methylovorum]
MTTGPEAIGKLLYNSALLQGERNLMVKRDAPLVHQAPTAAAPPLAHDGKTTAAVLMTLLEDQLEASDAKIANVAGSGEKQIAALAGNADPSRRVTQRYAENGFVSADDGVRHEMLGFAEQARLPGVSPLVSGDLASFIQRSAAMAAGQPVRQDASVSARRGGGVLAYLSGISTLRIAGVAVGTLWFGFLIGGWLLH